MGAVSRWNYLDDYFGARYQSLLAYENEALVLLYRDRYIFH
jgi:hypothetical protein